MLLKLRHTAVKVRRPNSEKFQGADKFTGTVTYTVIGTVDGQFVRLALGTEEEKAAIRRIEKIKTACAVGPDSPVWLELEESLPPRTFSFFSNKAGYKKSASLVAAKSCWGDLCDAFELEMKRLIANKDRGATREEGIMSQTTRDRYQQSIRHFTGFLHDKNTLLDNVGAFTIEKFKVQ
jgi:hypothetical protein